jgi:hypothetical protein
MLARCYRPTTNKFYRYGGRGIMVCESWHNFDYFYDDMYESFNKHAISNWGDTQLDRIDSDDHYYFENCQWVTRAENIRRKNMLPDGTLPLAGRQRVPMNISWRSIDQRECAKIKAKNRKTTVSKIIQDYFDTLPLHEE